MIQRRQFIVLGAAAVLTAAMPFRVQAAPMSRMTAYTFRFKGLDKRDIALSDYAGKPILVVNTASHCGYTPQYAGLQDLWTRFRDRGLLVLGVPSNDFGNQEPGGAVDIGKTAFQEYKVGFPLAAKAAVKGKDAHPFYRWAAEARPLETPRWNFHKYLIGRDGQIKAVFPSAVAPNDPRLIAAIETELAAG